MGGLRRSRERAAYAGVEGFPAESLVVRGPRGAVSYEDQRHSSGLGFRQVFSHEPATGEGAGHGEPCAYLDGVSCSPDSANRSAIARWESEGAFVDDEATFALLERQYEKWLGGEI